MKYIVTEMGPIDRHPPGTDVSGVYPATVLARLIEEGYVEQAGKPQKGQDNDRKKGHTRSAAR